MRRRMYMMLNDLCNERRITCRILKMDMTIDGELSQNMNTRVPSEPRYPLRKRNHFQLQQNTILFLTHEFEKLTIH